MLSKKFDAGTIRNGNIGPIEKGALLDYILNKKVLQRSRSRSEMQR